MTFTVPFITGEGVEAATARYITDRVKEQNPGADGFDFKTDLPREVQHNMKDQMLPAIQAAMPHAALATLVALKESLAEVPAEKRDEKLAEIIMELQFQIMF